MLALGAAAPAQLPGAPPPPVAPEGDPPAPAPGPEEEGPAAGPPGDDEPVADILGETVLYAEIREADDDPPGDDPDRAVLEGLRVTVEHRRLEGLIRERLEAHYAEKWELSVDEEAVENRAQRMAAQAPAARQVAESIEREKQVIIAAQTWLEHRDDPEAAYEEHVSDFLTRDGWRRQIREFEEQGAEETRAYVEEAEARLEALSRGADAEALRREAERALLREKLEDEIAERAGAPVTDEAVIEAYERVQGEAPPEDWLDSDAAQRIRRAMETEERQAAGQQFWAGAFEEHVRIRHARFADLAQRFQAN